MNANEIENMPAVLESNYGLFRGIIRESVAESLENGDVIEDTRKLYGDFMRALSHALDEYSAPTGTIDEITC